MEGRRCHGLTQSSHRVVHFLSRLQSSYVMATRFVVMFLFPSLATLEPLHYILEMYKLTVVAQAMQSIQVEAKVGGGWGRPCRGGHAE